jgi:hypothetical protein
MWHKRTLVCERCGRHQEAANRPILEKERELSYKWCVVCLDEAGPCAKPEEAGVPESFEGLTQHVINQKRGNLPRDLVDQRLLLPTPCVCTRVRWLITTDLRWFSTPPMRTR